MTQLTQPQIKEILNWSGLTFNTTNDDNQQLECMELISKKQLIQLIQHVHSVSQAHDNR